MFDEDKKKKFSKSICEGLPDLAAACPHHSELVYYFCGVEEQNEAAEEADDKKGR